MWTSKQALDLITQRPPRDAVRRRQSSNDNVSSRRYRCQQIEGHRFEATTNEIAFHGISHVLGDDEAEANRPFASARLGGTFSNIEHGVCTDDPHTAPYDTLVITAACDAIYVSKHEILAPM